MLATPEDVDTDTEIWDRIDLLNSDKMAIPSRRRGWVAMMVGGEMAWISDDVARRLGAELLEAGHRTHHD